MPGASGLLAFAALGFAGAFAAAVVGAADFRAAAFGAFGLDSFFAVVAREAAGDSGGSVRAGARAGRDGTAALDTGVNFVSGAGAIVWRSL